jgi:crotonobetainyl-CoA:carnitine CoA-transferase CaiB-like acyl-CoA transferase
MDKVTALNAVQSITAALLAKERGQGGQLIKLNMMDCAMHFLYPDSYWNKVWTDAGQFPVEWNQISAGAEYQV